MLFTRLGRIVAFIALAAGILQIAIGLMIAAGLAGQEGGALARYSSKLSTATVIDGGIYVALFAIGLGILTEISSSTSRI